jgi:glucokinase
MQNRHLLVGDIGGTNARFALANEGPPGFQHVVELRCADFETSGGAIRHYLDEVGVTSLDAVCLAAAGPVIDGDINVTNNHWDLRVAVLTSEFDVGAIRLVNDFEAVAYSLPFIGADDRMLIGPDCGRTLEGRDFDIAVLGPGTGLGVAGLSCRNGDCRPISGEGGHQGFAPESDEQVELLRIMRMRFERVSVERLVAGSGIENIYSALLEMRGEKGVLTAPEVFAAAGEPGPAADAVRVFFEILGQVAGDLVLTIGGFDGAYIAGGIARRYPEILANGAFRGGFESKGRYREMLAGVPTYLITHEQPGLLGASYVAQDLVVADS